MPMIQNVCPSVGIDVASGDRRSSPPGPAPPGMKKLVNMINAADHVGLVARHVDAREGHVRRSDLQRHDVVAERGEGQRHDGQEHHDRAVHRAEGIVKVRRHDALGRHVAEDRGQQRAHQRHRLARVGDLPAHDHHQAETEQQEQQGGDPILNADDLVVRGEHIRAPETRLLVGRLVNCGVWDCWGCGLHIHLTLSSTITANSSGRYTSEA